jgi:ElaA protein
MKLRQQVFVVEQKCAYLDADGLDRSAYHFMIYDNDQLAAYTRILDRGQVYEDYVAIGRVVTSQDYRGKGLGKELMLKTLEQCKKLFHDAPIKISAQEYLVKFYKHLNFKAVGEVYLEDDIPHIAMIYHKS